MDSPIALTPSQVPAFVSLTQNSTTNFVAGYNYIAKWGQSRFFFAPQDGQTCLI